MNYPSENTQEAAAWASGVAYGPLADYFISRYRGGLRNLSQSQRWEMIQYVFDHR